MSSSLLTKTRDDPQYLGNKEVCERSRDHNPEFGFMIDTVPNTESTDVRFPLWNNRSNLLVRSIYYSLIRVYNGCSRDRGYHTLVRCFFHNEKGEDEEGHGEGKDDVEE